MRVCQDEINGEIDKLSDIFVDWYFDHYDYDETLSEEEMLRQAQDDEMIRKEYSDWRFEDIIANCDF